MLGAVTVQIKIQDREHSALVDTGSTTLSVPADVVELLGIRTEGHKQVRSLTGITNVPWIRELRIEVMGRQLITDAIVAPAGTQIIIGCRQLEALDLIVRPGRHDVAFDDVKQAPRGRPGRYR